LVLSVAKKARDGPASRKSGDNLFLSESQADTGSGLKKTGVEWRGSLMLNRREKPQDWIRGGENVHSSVETLLPFKKRGRREGGGETNREITAQPPVQNEKVPM